MLVSLVSFRQETLDQRSEEKHVAELLEVADEWADSDRNGRKKKISGSWDALKWMHKMLFATAPLAQVWC